MRRVNKAGDFHNWQEWWNAPKKDKACDDWLDLGTCSKGAQCRFQHRPEEAGKMKGVRKRVKVQKKCDFWFKVGRCREGENCKYLHSTEKQDGKEEDGKYIDDQWLTQDEAQEGDYKARMDAYMQACYLMAAQAPSAGSELDNGLAGLVVPQLLGIPQVATQTPEIWEPSAASASTSPACPRCGSYIEQGICYQCLSGLTSGLPPQHDSHTASPSLEGTKGESNTMLTRIGAPLHATEISSTDAKLSSMLALAAEEKVTVDLATPIIPPDEPENWTTGGPAAPFQATMDAALSSLDANKDGMKAMVTTSESLLPPLQSEFPATSSSSASILAHKNEALSAVELAAPVVAAKVVSKPASASAAVAQDVVARALANAQIAAKVPTVSQSATEDAAKRVADKLQVSVSTTQDSRMQDGTTECAADGTTFSGASTDNILKAKGAERERRGEGSTVRNQGKDYTPSSSLKEPISDLTKKIGEGGRRSRGRGRRGRSHSASVTRGRERSRSRGLQTRKGQGHSRQSSPDRVRPNEAGNSSSSAARRNRGGSPRSHRGRSTSRSPRRPPSSQSPSSISSRRQRAKQQQRKRQSIFGDAPVKSQTPSTTDMVLQNSRQKAAHDNYVSNVRMFAH